MKNNLKTAVILAAIGGLMIMVGGAIGGSGGAAIGMAIGLVFVGGSYWFSDKLAIRSRPGRRGDGRADAPLPRHRRATSRQRAEIPMPRLYVAPDRQPNAFATGRNPSTRRSASTRASSTCSPGRSSRACSPTRSATSATATS